MNDEIDQYNQEIDNYNRDIDKENNNDNLIEKPSSPMASLIGIMIIFTVVIVGAIAVTSLGLLDPEEEIVDLNDNPVMAEDSELLTLIVTDQKPSALSHREHDYVADHLDHLSPSLKELQDTLYWAKQPSVTELDLIESEILEGAKLNENKITIGEQVMLEIINWSKYPELCEQIPPANQNCEFFDINYHEALYQYGEITRDEYWLSIKKYANQTVIDEVEGNLGS